MFPDKPDASASRLIGISRRALARGFRMLLGFDRPDFGLQCFQRLGLKPLDALAELIAHEHRITRAGGFNVAMPLVAQRGSDINPPGGRPTKFGQLFDFLFNGSHSFFVLFQNQIKRTAQIAFGARCKSKTLGIVPGSRTDSEPAQKPSDIGNIYRHKPLDHFVCLPPQQRGATPNATGHVK